MHQMEVDTTTKLAYAESQLGLASERKAKIHTDMAVAEDKLRRAEHEDTASLLNLVKAIKELQTMDVSNLSTKLEMLDKINSLNFEGKMIAEGSPGAALKK